LLREQPLELFDTMFSGGVRARHDLGITPVTAAA